MEERTINYMHLSSPHTKGERDKAMLYVSLGSKQQERATLRILIRGLHFSLFLAGDSKVVQLEMNDSLLAIYWRWKYQHHNTPQH
jgi:hypothetical protein